MKYEKPEMVIETFPLHDVVRTSQTVPGTGDNDGGWD